MTLRPLALLLAAVVMVGCSYKNPDMDFVGSKDTLIRFGRPGSEGRKIEAEKWVEKAERADEICLKTHGPRGRCPEKPCHDPSGVCIEVSQCFYGNDCLHTKGWDE